MKRFLQRCAISAAIIMAVPAGWHFAFAEEPQADGALVPLSSEADGNRGSSLKLASAQPAAHPQSAPVSYDASGSENPLREAAVAMNAVAIETEALPQVETQEGSSLQEIEFMALTGNPALREASASVAVAQGNAIQVGLLPNPGFFTSAPQLAGSDSQYNAVFTQDFITAGKLRLSRETALRAVEQAQLGFTKTRFDVLSNVRQEFYRTAAAQRRVEVLESLVGVASRSRDVGQKLLQAGEANRADATLLDIEYDRAFLARDNAHTTLAAARKRLAAVVGAPETDFGRLRFDFSVPLPNYELEVVRLGVVDRNAIAAIAAVEIQRTQWALRRELADRYPNFNLQGGYQYSVSPPLHDQGYAQFTTSIPLWNRNQGGIAAARADVARAGAALRRTENELSQRTAEALATYLPAVERTIVYRDKILPKAQEVFRVNQSLYEQGQTDFLRLLQAQRTLIEADLGYLEAQEERWTSAAVISGLLQQEQFP